MHHQYRSQYRYPYRCSLLAALLVVFGFAAGTRDARAQELNPRFGLGFNTLLSTADGLGFGFRGRASAPVNADFSLGVDIGFTGFVLEGRRDATYVFDPQLSAIVNLPARGSRLTYALFGLGAYVPIGDESDSQSGPTLHGGIGWVHALRESSIFYEIDPAIVIGERGIDLAIPIRVGLIF